MAGDTSKEPDTVPESLSSRMRAPVFDRLKHLKCFQELHQKIVDGWPLREVARWVQLEQEESTDIGFESLVSILGRYRQHIKPITPIRDVMPASLGKKMAEVEKKLDELEALAELYEIQKARIDMDHTLEKQFKKSLNTVGNDIRIAKEIAEASVKLKVEMGVIEKKPIKVETDLTVSLGLRDKPGLVDEKVQQVLDDPQKRTRLLRMAKQLLSTASNDSGAEPEDAELAPAAEQTISTSAVDDG